MSNEQAAQTEDTSGITLDGPEEGAAQGGLQQEESVDTGSAPAKKESDKSVITEAFDAEGNPIDLSGYGQEIAQKRIDKITGEKHEERRRRKAAEKKTADLQSKHESQSDDTPEPKLEDFDYDADKHNDALVNHRAKKLAKQQRVDDLTQEKAETAQRKQQESANEFATKAVKFSASVDNYQEVVGNVPELPQSTFDALLAMGPEAAYFIGNRLDLGDDLANATPMEAGIILGGIKAQLAAVAPSPRPSAAPNPIEPLASGGSIPSAGGPKGATYE